MENKLKQNNTVYEVDNLLFKNEENKQQWKHMDIMENKEMFKEYIIQLTDTKKLVKDIENNQLLKILIDNSSTTKNFINRITAIIKEINQEDFDSWKQYKINKYVNLFVNQIKEEQTFCAKSEVHKFQLRMKRERNKENFIIENIYRINIQHKKINVVRLNNKVSKQEYIDNLNIVMNILLLIDYLYSMYDAYISHSYVFGEKQKITSIIKNQFEYADMFQQENMYKCLNTLLYMFYQLTVLEENND